VDSDTLNSLTIDALEKALQLETPSRLKPAAKKPGLLPPGPATTAKTAATKECLDATLGLFDVTGTATEQLVRITRAGVAALLKGKPPAEWPALLDKAAAPLKPVAKEVALELAAAELKTLAKQQAELAARVGALRGQLIGMVREQLADVERQLGDVSAEAESLRKIAQEPPPPPLTPPPPPGNPAGRQPSPRAETDADTDFQRDLCRELALTWQDTPEPEARQALERVMFNTGLEQVGEVGDVVAFDASQHDVESALELFPGQSAEVVEAGWEFTSHRGTLRLVRPRVVPSAPNESPAHAPHA
jgi:hypothetical protein